MKKPNETNFSKLYSYLQLGGKYSAKELSETFQTSLRSMQGYLKQLREEYGLQKEGKYYFFTDEYRHIEIDEKVQMSTALMISLYKNAIPLVDERVLQNFKKIPKETDAFLFDIDFQPIENETYFNQVTGAIIHKRAIHFRYKNTKNIISTKNIYPLKNINVLGYWYLMGYDLEQDKIKSFYFNNIKELIVSKDESYLSEKQMKELNDKSLQIDSVWFNDDKRSVKLKITGDAVRYILRKKGDMFTIIKQNKSSLIVSMQYYNDIEVLTFVKKWIPFVQIEDNEDLKSKLYETLKEYLLS
ncbi:WYL domain-containing protein [Sulfurimonas sp. NW15]|uniref:helix-turn-helix transcriptional regulator n=1 Tax=Sulfurimonas sp. NW15 TaxID=2922729 RepID=UPI003DA81D73